MGTPFLGLTEYFFTSDWNLGKFLSLQHIITIPLGLFCLYWIKPKRKDAWKISLAIISSFYVLTIFLTDSLQNVNCAFRACGQIQVSQGYPFIWFGLFIMSILITNFVLSRIFVQEKKKINQPSQS